jgi:hypothetical protein
MMTLERDEQPVEPGSHHQMPSDDEGRHGDEVEHENEHSSMVAEPWAYAGRLATTSLN